MRMVLYALSAVVLLVAFAKACPGSYYVDLEERLKGHVDTMEGAEEHA